MTRLDRSAPSPASALAPLLRGAFAQPAEQALPQDFIAMLMALDRAKREHG